MDPQKSQEFTCPKKSVEVFYIPDDQIHHIIPIAGQTPKEKIQRKQVKVDLYNVRERLKTIQNHNPTPKTTRSGRRITNQLCQMSIKDSPEKQVLNSNEPDSEELSDVEKPDGGVVPVLRTGRSRPCYKRGLDRRRVEVSGHYISSHGEASLLRDGEMQALHLTNPQAEYENGRTRWQVISTPKSIVGMIGIWEIRLPNEVLFDEDEDGQAIFSFRTPKRQGGMVSKASEMVKSMEYTPSRRDSFPTRGRGRGSLYNMYSGTRGDMVSGADNAPKTPYSLRNKIRKRLADEAAQQELERLLEDSGSDFVPSSSDSESETSSDSDSNSSSDGGASSRLKGMTTQPSYSAQDVPAITIKTRSKKLKDYVIQSEDYFSRQHAKIMTSNNRLSKLKNPKMAPSKLTSILRKVEKKHVHSYQQLESVIEKSFKRWLFAFSEGFNVMLYGLGSKKHILQYFHEKWLKEGFVCFVSGFFPDNTVKQIFENILKFFYPESDKDPDKPNLPHEILELIRKEMASQYALRIFILLANLDGKFLQDEKAQFLLSQLLKIPKIHLLATIDHINSPLLWDQSKLSAFNFIWEDATTFTPYTEETSYEGSLMVNWSGGMALSSLKNVFTSLTTNSRKVFKILLKYHLENIGPKYSGMHFSDLYRECRSGFVVSSDLALRTLLTEFMDHQLVKWKKETDHLLITVDTPVLTEFQAEMDYLN